MSLGQDCLDWGADTPRTAAPRARAANADSSCRRRGNIESSTQSDEPWDATPASRRCGRNLAPGSRVVVMTTRAAQRHERPKPLGVRMNAIAEPTSTPAVSRRERGQRQFGAGATALGTGLSVREFTGHGTHQ